MSESRAAVRFSKYVLKSRMNSKMKVRVDERTRMLCSRKNDEKHGRETTGGRRKK
jgi:hypothetical protein